MTPVDDLLVIGRFARLSGLSVVATARTIGRLRDLEVPLETIRAVVATDDSAERQRLLGEHRLRIEARVHRLQRLMHVVGQISQGKEPIVTDTPSPPSSSMRPTTAGSGPTCSTSSGRSSSRRPGRRPRPTR